jgi:L-rhamnose isomerase/sugar isomerase
MREIYAAIPGDWRLFIEHKMYEPAFYSTVINDWGTSYYCARELGEKAACLVDLGHHAPNVNIEQIVSRLIQFRSSADSSTIASMATTISMPAPSNLSNFS